MEPNSLAIVIAGAIGLLTGVVAVLAFNFSERERRGTPVSSDRGRDLASILALLPSAAIVMSSDNTILRATPAAYALGLIKDEHLAHEEMAQLVDEVRNNGEITDTEMTVPLGLKSSGSLDLAVRVAPLLSTEVLILAEDRTEVRRLEETRRDLVANVSHELKTPIGAISLLAETIADSADNPEVVRRFATNLEQESHRLSELVQDIIEFSRIQEIDVFDQPHTVSIDAVTSKAIDQLSSKAKSHEVHISSIGDTGLHVVGDEGLLTTAVRNLLENAIAYSPTGSEVGLRTRTTRNKVIVEVVDHGIGISTEDSARIFERFYRADSARSRITGGTGLGLSIVKHVAQNHGGQVKVQSQIGVGSTFILELPRRSLPTTVKGTSTEDDYSNDTPPQPIRGTTS